MVAGVRGGDKDRSLFFAVFIPFLSAAIGTLGVVALQQPLEQFIALIPKIIVAIVLVVIGAVVAGAVKTLIQNALGGLSYGKVLATVVSLIILLGFVKAALDQVGIATTVTGPLLYAILGTVAGVVIVGAGGGLIKPMQGRWESLLNKAELETQNAKAQVQNDSRPRESRPAASAEPYPSTTGTDPSTTGTDPSTTGTDPSTTDMTAPTSTMRR